MQLNLSRKRNICITKWIFFHWVFYILNLYVVDKILLQNKYINKSFKDNEFKTIISYWKIIDDHKFRLSLNVFHCTQAEVSRSSEQYVFRCTQAEVSRSFEQISLSCNRYYKSVWTTDIRIFCRELRDAESYYEIRPWYLPGRPSGRLPLDFSEILKWELFLIFVDKFSNEGLYYICWQILKWGVLVIFVDKF